MNMKRLLFILLLALLVALTAAVLFSQGSIDFSQNRREAVLCDNCHEMSPNVITWRLSSHQNIGCLNCHQDITLTTFAYRHWRGFFQTPIQGNFIPDQTCRQCHSDRRQLTMPANLNVPHALHSSKQVDCIDCHAKIVHRGISKNPLLKQLSFPGEYTEAKLLPLARHLPSRVQMAECKGCHNGAMASNRCSGCHPQNKGK
ncbi:cytochrome c3 family protein [Carboxydocella sp. ULO1]|uniref:cytochrome c3 family protein n=1 Tax=Carboxydocella sp. ULO1 TaxID=1926599 RepID=UPI0009AD0672|nr:cytochrome c3 family protein [Carboxydocella sp. ULO1]GAW28532.1 cytochrome c, NapC/NirT family [Carboxydocella sp. ULO1]